MEEESFPRGGKKISSEKPSEKKKHRNQRDVLFPNEKQPHTKRPRKESQTKLNNNVDVPIELSHVARSLSYKQVQEGMLMLGCIKKIKNISIEIELPGIIHSRVEITSISDSFTNYLKNNIDSIDVEKVLNNMFKIGQFVVVKVIKVEETEKGDVVLGSINPSDINFGRRHSSFKKEMLVWACVQSELDHGYHLTLGINNCNIFLPINNIDDGKKYVVGEPLWAVVHKVQSTQAATILRVSAKLQQVVSCKASEINNLYEVVPGTRFQVLVEKVTTHGIYGKILDNFFGYIDENQLNIPLSKVKEGKVLDASVIFVDHTIKTVHLTTYNIDYVPTFLYEIGDIKTAEVIRKGHRGLYLKLGNEQRGFITNRRLMKSIKRKPNVEIKDLINNKFAVGSRHTARIIDKNYMERVFICSFEKEILQQKVFNMKDVKIGLLINVKIIEITPNGFVVASGTIRGFVPNFHISKGAFTENIKKKFPLNTYVNARVLSVHGDTIIFTMKEGLVESDMCLSSVEEVNLGVFYPGVIVSAKKNGALVAFYNDIKGWISSKQITVDEQQQDLVDVSKYFYTGQVVKFTVIKVKNGDLTLSLKPPLKNIKIGTIVDAVVTAINDHGVAVSESKRNTSGFIPLAHLSTNLYLCNPLLKTYKVGDTISNLMCVSKSESNYIFSKREAKISKRFGWRVLTFNAVKKGSLIRCFYESANDIGIFVTPFLKGYSKQILILKQNIVDLDEDMPSFVYHQSFVARILEIDDNTQQMQLCIKLDSVFNNNIEETIDLFQDVLEEEELLKQHGSARGLKIAEYELGERVTCRVEQVAQEGGCLVKLPNGSSGLVPAHLSPSNLRKGTLLEGVILAHDFEDNYLEISLKKEVNAKISCVQNGETDITFKTKVVAEKLLLRNNYVLSTIKQDSCNNQLVYLPIRLHENDFNTIISLYTQPSFKIEICRKIGTKLIGISRRLKIALEKTVEKIDRKRKLSESSECESSNKEIGELNESKKYKTEIDSTCKLKLPNKVKKSKVETDVCDESKNFKAEGELKLVNKAKTSKVEADLCGKSKKCKVEGELKLPNKVKKSKVETDVSGKSKKCKPESELKLANKAKKSKNKIDECNKVCSEVKLTNKIKKSKVEIDSSYESDEQEISDDVSEKSKNISFEDSTLEDSDDIDLSPDLTNGNDSEDSMQDSKEDQELESDLNSEISENEQPPQKELISSQIIRRNTKEAVTTEGTPVLPGVGSFYNPEEPEEESESDDEIETSSVPTKKKKLSAAERAQLQRQKEEIIEKLERELADNMSNPQSVEQFNRLVLANPNSSETWLKYMSFHMANMDQEKARAVAKQALNKIDMTLTDEKFNIWNALLHLENDYNTEEEFEKVFQEALSYNDPLRVYLKAIEILGESGKLAEMEEKVNKIRRKFKHDATMWEAVGKNYYLLNKFKEARNFKDAALKSIKDKKTQFNLIVKFAIMEFQYGEVDAGSAIFETIVQSDPTKVNVWLTYVNQLIKKGSIDAARSVFERSVCQKISSKSMKTLFNKFIEFEEKHGTRESRMVVSEKLKDYIKKQLN